MNVNHHDVPSNGDSEEVNFQNNKQVLCVNIYSLGHILKSVHPTDDSSSH